MRLPAPLSAIDDDNRDMTDREILLKASDMEQIFEIPLRRTKELLIEQLKEADKTGKVNVKYVFMVGGFAESPYMKREISKLLLAYGNIQAIKPTHAWSAIVRGATAKGLEHDSNDALVKVRKCRRHYGTPCNELFRAEKHQESESFICKYTGQKRAGNQMDWLIKKGNDLSTSVTIHGQVEMTAKFWIRDSKVATSVLVASDVDAAPRLSTDKDVYNVAELTIDLGRVPKNKFRKKRSPDGDVYHCLDFQIEISVQASLEYSLLVDGKRYGSVKANYA